MNTRLYKKVIALGLLVFLLQVTQAQAGAISVPKLLQSKDSPAGVVIEIVSGNDDALRRLMPKIRDSIKNIREKFGHELEIAIVSHGREQFALTKDNADVYGDVHKALKNISDSNVDIHVCATHASWNNIDEDDFAEFINVSPAGPAQINDYIALGFVHVMIL